MSRVRRVRFLAIAVLALAALLIVMSRQLGRGDLGDSRGQRRITEEATPGAERPGQAGAAVGTAPALSFYDTLGVTAGGGTRSSAGSVPRTLNDSGDIAPAGAYVIQVLATRDRAHARRVRDRVAALGMPARLLEGEVDGVTIYRVRVGRYRERRTAVAWAEKIEAKLKLKPWVLQEAR